MVVYLWGYGNSLKRFLATWHTGSLKNRPFSNVEDFLTRLPANYQKNEYILPLIRVGAFDKFDGNRHKIEENLENLFVFVNELGVFLRIHPIIGLNLMIILRQKSTRWSRKFFGVGLSPHPLAEICQTF